MSRTLRSGTSNTVRPPHAARLAFLTIFLSCFLPLFHEGPYSAETLQITLAWDPPETNCCVAGYRLHFGNSSGEYDSSIDAGNQTSLAVEDLESGKVYYFAVSAYYTDGSEGGFSNEVRYEASRVNHDPVAEDGTLSLMEDGEASGVLRASDAGGDSLTFRLLSSGTKGTATLLDPANGTYTYSPQANASGTDTFSFSANDGNAESNPATITVTIIPVDDPPVALDGVLSVVRGSQADGRLSARDPDGDGLTFTLIRKPRKGQVTVTDPKTGAYTYSPYPNGKGVDSFDFQALAGSAPSNRATVVVTIVPFGEVGLEAEEGILDPSLAVARDTEASKGSYIWSPQREGALPESSQFTGEAEYLFTVPASGVYTVWARVSSSNTSQTTFEVSLDHGEAIEWNAPISSKDTWVWSQIRYGSLSSPASFYLGGGEHTLSVKQRGDGSRVDRIVLTTRKDFSPGKVYEDAEDCTVRGWRIAGMSPENARVANGFDSERRSRVIQFEDTDAPLNRFELLTEELRKWSDSKRFIAQWSMKSSHGMVVRFELLTTDGTRYLRYSPSGADLLGDEAIIRFGLGEAARDGKWHTFVRDLKADLRGAQPNIEILEVKGLAVRGPGRLDDVELRENPSASP